MGRKEKQCDSEEKLKRRDGGESGAFVEGYTFAEERESNASRKALTENRGKETRRKREKSGGGERNSCFGGRVRKEMLQLCWHMDYDAENGKT